jgi:CRP-like cAMP-binding protein
LPFAGGSIFSIPIFANLLLQRLSEEDRASLGEPELVTLPLRQSLHAADGAISHVYFIEQGIASVVANVEGKMAVELGLIGPEGMAGLGAVYGDRGSPFHVFMQSEGAAYRFDFEKVAGALDRRPALRKLLLRYARTFAIQVATTALANGRSKLDERLCRWLLMVSDRVGNHFSITHEFIALMLAVRRSGVTLALQILEGEGLIRATRGHVSILDRDGLIEHANGAYGFAEREYERLMGVSARHAGASAEAV